LKKLSLVLVFCLTVAANAVAYSRIVSSSGNGAHWASMPINYFINLDGSPQINNDSEFAAVHAAFQTWANVSTANVRFNYGGPAVISTGAGDAINLVSFTDTSFPFGSGTLAVTLNYFSDSTGITSEADILFNPNQLWSTSGESGRYDIQSVMTHEIGHFLGIDHSALISSVMSPFGLPGQVDQRVLQYDDVAAVSEIYPAGSLTVGRITGLVRSGSQSVKGAHVVAVDADGTPRVSTLSATDGSFSIPFLPGGNYRIYAEPLDGPISESSVSGFYAPVNTNFGTTYYPSASTLDTGLTVPVVVGAATTPVYTINVLPRSASSLNISRPSFAPRIGRSSSGTLTLSGFDLTNGVLFTASSSSHVLLGGPVFSTSSSSAPTSASIQLTVSSNAPIGPKNIAVNRGTDAAVGSGVIVIVDTKPTGITVSPGTGPAAGGIRVNVTGSNFRAGARVYFGGLASTDVRYISSTLLDVLTPANLPGSVLVLVVNEDGTNGVTSSGYVYETDPPLISNVSPLSGPPTTLVTIDGSNFDPFNAQVSFNGVAANIASITATRIQTTVPYGATTGAISVSSFGRTAAGPVFTVTEPVGSTNLASTSYAFTDASAGAGGTALTFSSNDDGRATLTLPFTFSLFRDIYPAGSQITVATNGFISLQEGAASEFQNGQLPASAALQPSAAGCFSISGQTRTMPRSLIGPFFDDLTLIPGVSSVTSRVVGTAPNRRLIVQWSRLSVLDESGCDLHATLSFQAVLFEGSNDIQFLYETLTGPRSDGISATVGLQDFARTTGVQTSFNEARLRAGVFVTYRFSDGQYAVFASDGSAPTTPVVLDGGAATNSTSSLSASWSSADPESGIREYQYAIGTTAGASNVLAFTTTSSNFAVAGGLSLTAGSTYYFSVRAVNNEGLVSGILVNPSLTFSSRVIPFVQDTAARYTGVALLAPSAMSVTLTAVTDSGAVVATKTVSLNPGQQYAKLVSELFNLPTFEGWIEVLPTAPGLGVLAATGSRDSRDLDASIPRDLSVDFVALHAGATLWIVNPSTLSATVTLTGVGGSTATTLTIPGRGRISTTLQIASRVTSTQPLAAMEVVEQPERLAIYWPESSSGATSLTFPHAVTGAGYTTTLTLVNLGPTTNATVQYLGFSREVLVPGNTATALTLNSLFQVPADLRTDAVRITTPPTIFGNPILIGTADIATPWNLVFLGSRPQTTEFVFPHVAQDATLFTGLAFVTGSAGATITIDVYTPNGDVRKSGTVFVGPNQQIARLLGELVPTVTTHIGGYIRVRADQPILAWEVYGSQEAFASAPPL
jgi:hypothetical protein